MRPKFGFGHLLFLICLVTHVRLAAIGWTNPLLDQHDFRQCQTAITTQYTIQEGYRLDYPTPVLGRPWSIPFEFPLYQWIVAALVRASRMPLDQAGRLVSLLCFYLALVPTRFVLRHFLDDTERILIVLSLILASPVYIFWSRTFMIESLALLLSMSFLAFALAAICRGDWRFIAAASAFGIAAGVVKITTFLVFCAPAGVMMIQSFLAAKASPLNRRLLTWSGYGIGLFGPALAATKLWTDFADAVKAKNPLAGFLLSSNLKAWTLGSLHQRLLPETYVSWAKFAFGPLIGRWEALLLIPIAMLLTRPVVKKGAVLSFTGLIAGPLVFTNLYAIHSYYWYACGIFLVILLGLYIVSFLDLPLNKWLIRLLLIPIPFVLFYNNYATADLPRQRSPNERIKVLGEAVASATGTDAVLLTYGFDWSPSLPYYSQRRALMAREGSGGAYTTDPATNQPVDTEAMTAAVADLKDDPIQAMAVAGPLRRDPAFIAERTKHFGLAPVPVFDALDTAIFVTPAESTQSTLALEKAILYRYCNFSANPISVSTGGSVDAVEIGSVMALVTPEPSEMVFGASPDLVSISGSFGFAKEAYSNNPKTAGAEFSIEYQSGNGRQTLFSKFLDPAKNRKDRGLQVFTVPVPAGAGGKLYFRTTNPTGSFTSGLTSWSGIDLHEN